MIHSQGGATRRLAVIKMQRPNQTRLGTINNGSPSPNGARNNAAGWSTISDAPPDSSANWMAMQLQAQDQARVQTPGMLTYTPASTTPVPNVAPWNSWAQPNCLTASQDPPAHAGVDPGSSATDPASKWTLFFGLLGAAAATIAIAQSVSKEKRRT